MSLPWIKAIILLPFNATVAIPALILYFTGKLAAPTCTFYSLAGMLMFLAGLLPAAWTMLLFAQIGKGTLAPWAPTKKLVVSGPYSHLRNPMLSGIIIMLFGESLIFSSWGIFAWGVLFFIINTFYFIFSEEVGLEKRFGDEYALYKKNVPRWIPRIRPWKR